MIIAQILFSVRLIYFELYLLIPLKNSFNSKPIKNLKLICSTICCDRMYRTQKYLQFYFNICCNNVKADRVRSETVTLLWVKLVIRRTTKKLKNLFDYMLGYNKANKMAYLDQLKSFSVKRIDGPHLHSKRFVTAEASWDFGHPPPYFNLQILKSNVQFQPGKILT